MLESCVPCRLRIAVSLLLGAVLAPIWAPSARAVSERTLIAPTFAASEARFGNSVGTAGDFNGDGYDDVIVGAYLHDLGGSNTGVAGIHYGGPDADTVTDLFLLGATAGDTFGSSVGPAGDWNRDGYGDVIVGAPLNDAGGADAGRAYIYFGGSAPDNVADVTLTGVGVGDQFGCSVGTAGDVNGDGYTDVIIGAWLHDDPFFNAGTAYVIFNNTGPGPIPPTLKLTPSQIGEGFGLSVGTAGDVNGDGYADVIVGAPLADPSGNADAGRYYVYYGGSSPNATADLSPVGSTPGNQLGYCVGTAGDVNGDGYDDWLFSSPFFNANTGVASVCYGSASPDFVADLGLSVPMTGLFQGYSAGCAGDVNADGYDDVIVGAYGSDLMGTDAGAAHVYYGGSSPNTTVDHILTGSAAGDEFGHAVGAAGDVDGDGYDDVIAGAWLHDGGVTNGGQARVTSFYSYRVLSPNGGERWVAGRSATVRWEGHDIADLAISVDAGLTWDLLTPQVGGLEDNELTVTVPAIVTDFALVRLTYSGQAAARNNSAESDAVFSIVHPRREPPATSRLELTLTGAAAGDGLGYASGTAGDVNGDGFDDVIVGAFRNDAGGADAGRAYILFGGPSADAVPDVTLTGAAAGDFFGCAVGTAGDVNGDGLDDVIVGAYGNDAAGADAGRAYLYFGGASMDVTSDRTFTGVSAGDIFGYAVGAAGDVNDDGYDDVIVGAYLNDFGGLNAGRAYVYYGGPSADSVSDVILTGASAGDQFGQSVWAAGDVNGDGSDDVIVGAPLNDVGGTNAGSAYVYYGGPAMDATADVTVTGTAAGDFLGEVVGTAGDMNGDGYTDLIVGAQFNDAGGTDAGRAYVCFGGPSADGVPDLVMTGAAAGDSFGAAVGTAGDVNGDGCDDVIVSALLDDASGIDAGRSFVYYGGVWPDAHADLTLSGASAGASFGNSVGTAGDLNGDGHDDLIVGERYNDSGGPDAGRVYVYDCNRFFVTSPNGGETWNVGEIQAISWQGSERADVWFSTDGGDEYELIRSNVGGAESNAVEFLVPDTSARLGRVRVTPSDDTISGADESDGLFAIVAPHRPPEAVSRLDLTFTGAATGDAFGNAVATAGDVNGDGYADVIVGADKDDTGGADAGRAYVHFGGPASDSVADLTLTGTAAGDFFGYSVNTAGDVNGDGYADVVVGAYGNDAGGADAGRAYVYFGGPSGGDSVADVTLTGAAAGDNFGIAVSAAGDVNGDGYADVIVAGYNNDAGGANAGRAYVYFGGPSGGDSVADLILTGAAAGDNFGVAVSTAGDVNGDGFDDVIVGAFLNDAGGADTGRAYVYYGGRSADATADLTLTGPSAGERFGLSVGTAGDLNGDGHADAIVGAPNNDVGGTDAGRAYVCFGGPLADAVPDLVMTGAAAGDLFGYAVGTAGDVNGDSYADVMVAALWNDASGTDAGRACIYYGGPVPDASADLTLSGAAAGDEFGSSVSAAGDMNGDGMADLIVGARSNDAGGTNAGRVYVYDCNRYFVTSPNGGELWNVGAAKSISWTGAELADVWFSVDGGRQYDRIRTNVGGSASNLVEFRVPHAPTHYARVKVTPTDTEITGGDEGDSTYTIQSSVTLLRLEAERAADGSAELSWSSEPGVGPEGLAGYRLYRDDTRVGPELIGETDFRDPEAAPGSTYRLIAVNGLQEELELGQVTFAASLVGLRLWPSPLGSRDVLNVQFAAPLAAPGFPATDLDVGIFDTGGRRVATLVRGLVAAAGGVVSLRWESSDRVLPANAGVYFVRVSAPSVGYRAEGKLLVVR